MSQASFIPQSDWITRQDAIALSGLSSGQLSRLDAAGTIVPKKLGGSTHPVVLYSQSQLLELQLVAKLKNKLISSEIKAVCQSWRDLDLAEKDLKGFVLLFDGNAYFASQRSALFDLIKQVVNDYAVAEFKVVELQTRTKITP